MAHTALLADSDRHAARRWLGLAVAVLIVAGLLALLLVLARMPPFDRLVTDPQWFRRCLVVHVVLSLVVWFYSFAAALLFALPARRGGERLGLWSARVGTAGVCAIVGAAWLPGVQPVMSNYVPMLDHWLFGLGLAGFGVAVAMAVASRRLLPGPGIESTWPIVPAAALPGLRAVAVALLLAGATFFASWCSHPPGLGVQAHYELLFWGCGHVLQLASVAAMLVCWSILLGALLGRPPISRRASALLFAVLIAPWTVAPILPLGGTTANGYHTGFTTLMQWGLFPVVLAFVALSIVTVRRARRDGVRCSLRDPRWSGFAISVALTALGFGLGAAIRGPTTVVPAHYHASIGAVTVAFMAAAYVALPCFGMQLSERLRRLAALQPLVYGGGQAVFALGFGFAGAHGAARKVYGHEQAGRALGESAGLIVMGVGGVIAVAGGVMFLWILAASWLRRSARIPALSEPDWSQTWSPLANTRSSG